MKATKILHKSEINFDFKGRFFFGLWLDRYPNYRKSSIKHPGGLFICCSLRGGLLERGDLLIIQGKNGYNDALMHFFCNGKTVLTASKVY